MADLKKSKQSKHKACGVDRDPEKCRSVVCGLSQGSVMYEAAILYSPRRLFTLQFCR